MVLDTAATAVFLTDFVMNYDNPMGAQALKSAVLSGIAIGLDTTLNAGVAVKMGRWGPQVSSSVSGRYMQSQKAMTAVGGVHAEGIIGGEIVGHAVGGFFDDRLAP